jgi:beta-glucosidase
MDARIRAMLAATIAALCLLAAALPGTASAAGRAHRATARPSSRPHRATAKSSSVSNPNCPWLNDAEPIGTRVAQVMARMTLAQEIDLVEGHGTSEPYVFYEPPIPSLCIPQLGEEDGPAGVADGNTGVTQLPAGVDLAATFSTGLARRYGAVIGSEEWGKGAAVNLGPTVNLDRDPRWGRSFESLTEDPYLSGSLGSAEIKGVQGTGEMSQVKHYDDYDQETYRNTPQDDEVMTVRTLHELYLKSFETIVADANPASAMCSYSSFSIIGSPDPSEQYACQDNYLENQTLKADWNFPGFITSDYGALHSTDGILDGTDQEQPFNTYFGQALQTDIQNGTIPRSYLNTAISRELYEMFRFNLFDNPPTGTTSAVVTTRAHVQTGNQIAQDGTTLLKNAGSTLPLSPSGGSIALIGPAASASPVYGGGGSAYVIPSKTVSPLQGVSYAMGRKAKLSYTQGLPTDASLPAIPSSALSPAYAPTPYGGSYQGTLTAPETGTYVLAVTNDCGCYTSTYLTLDGRQILDNPSTPPNHVYSVAVKLVKGHTYSLGIQGSSSALTWATPSALAPGIAAAVKAAKSAQTPVVVVSDDTESEATDRLSLALPSAQNELISAVAKANPRTVVVIDAGAPVTMPWLTKVSSVLDAWYPGETNGKALADVLFGRADPSGHLPVTFPRSLSQVPAHTPAQWPGVNGQVHFSEGLEIGYRWYDAQNITPLFPFGYGLSYTTFSYRHLRVTPSPAGATGDVTVSATVTNTGSRAGADVAQLYLEDPAAAGEPPRQLAGFKRVMLKPGQSRQLTFTITPQDEQVWDSSAQGWSQTPGSYGVALGDSSATADLPLQGSFTLATTPGSREVSVQAPSTMTPGSASTVTVNLSASGTQTLPKVRLALQLPQGWTATPVGPATFTNVAPGTPLSAQFSVTPPADSPNINAVVHATAKLGPDLTREAGTFTTVG